MDREKDKSWTLAHSIRRRNDRPAPGDSINPTNQVRRGVKAFYDKRKEVEDRLNNLKSVSFCSDEEFSRLKEGGLIREMLIYGILDHFIQTEIDISEKDNSISIRSSPPSIENIIKKYVENKKEHQREQEPIENKREQPPPANIVYPGLILQQCLRELGLTVAAAARLLGVSRQHFFKVVYGEIAVSPEMAVRLEKGFGIKAEEWLRTQAAYDLTKVDTSDMSIKLFDPVPLRGPRSNPKKPPDNKR